MRNYDLIKYMENAYIFESECYELEAKIELHEVFLQNLNLKKKKTISVYII